MIVFERADLLFIFNLHPTASYTEYRVGVQKPGEYYIVLSSDEKRFGGWDNVDLKSRYFTTPMKWNNRDNWLQVIKQNSRVFAYYSPQLVHQVYIPSRTCLVLAK